MYVTLEEAIYSLLGDENVCSEQAVVILLPEQGDGYATNLELGEDVVSRSLETSASVVAV